MGLWGCSSSVSAPKDDAGAGDAAVTPDAPLACGAPSDAYLRITYTGPGMAMDCTPGPTSHGSPPTVVTRTAVVVSVADDAEGSTLAVDFCSPAADCVAQPGTLRVQAPGFALGAGSAALRTGQFVQIRARATWSWGCTMQVEISNAASWGGLANPVRHDGALLAAAASGEATPLPDATFGVARQSIGCVVADAGTGCGGGPPETFAMSFQGHCRSCLRDPDPVVVAQGATGTVGLDESTYTATNLRSYNSGACDDYWNYDWTLRER